MGTSLWLVPDTDSDAVKLDRIMTKTGNRAKSPSSYPRFHPHLTLATVPSTNATDSVLRSAVKGVQSHVPVKFKSVDVGDKYFMSVYVTAQRTPELVRLRERLSRVLGENAVPPVPHLSLFYIDDSDAAERQKIATELRGQGRVIDGPEGKSVRLDCSEGDTRGQDVLGGFVGHEIWVVVCDGPVETWQQSGDRILLFAEGAPDVGTNHPSS